MIGTALEKAAHLRGLATQFRGFAAQTEWPGYRSRMLEMAEELDRQAAQLQPYRALTPVPGTSRAG